MAKPYLLGEPYKLYGHRMAFTNWFYVRPGSGFYWCDGQGKRVSVVGDQELLDGRVTMVQPDRPWGVRLAVKAAARSGPLLCTERPWEKGGVGLATLMQEEGRYRAWYTTSWGDLKTKERYFCSMESGDGVHWERPNYGLVDLNGSRENNVVCSGSVEPRLARGGMVFVDPSAPASERYKMLNIINGFTVEECERLRSRRPDAIDPRAQSTATEYSGIVGGVSPDGLRWTTLPDPLFIMYSDCTPGMYYDAVHGKYVGFFRDWLIGKQEVSAAGGTDKDFELRQLRHAGVGRRAIGRSESDDFRSFPLSETILETRPEWRPTQVLYTPTGITAVPGNPEQRLLFTSVWDTSSDTTHIEMVASHDGKVWHWLPNGDVLHTAECGQWDGGCVFAEPNLVELPNGDFALPYSAYNMPHKYPRVKATRNTGYALWPKGRLMAIEAPEIGEFSTVAVVPPGSALRINALTQRAGHILVEAAKLGGEPIPGREFANAVPIIGDQYRTPVVWKGHPDLGIAPGEAVMLRFRLSKASIYWLEFEG